MVFLNPVRSLVFNRKSDIALTGVMKFLSVEIKDRLLRFGMTSSGGRVGGTVLSLLLLLLLPFLSDENDEQVLSKGCLRKNNPI